MIKIILVKDKLYKLKMELEIIKLSSKIVNNNLKFNLMGNN